MNYIKTPSIEIAYLDMAAYLKIDRFSVIGHDWGGRIAYTLASLIPQKIKVIVALSVAHEPYGRFPVPSFTQSRRFWYQWFMCLDKTRKKVEDDPVGFSRIQWDTWSPGEWYQQADFDKAAESLREPDFSAIMLNGYRSRWIPEELKDEMYNALRQRLKVAGKISVPTLMIQGQEDDCDPPEISEDQIKYFSNGYERLLLEGIGHFPHGKHRRKWRMLLACF